MRCVLTPSLLQFCSNIFCKHSRTLSNLVTDCPLSFSKYGPIIGTEASTNIHRHSLCSFSATIALDGTDPDRPDLDRAEIRGRPGHDTVSSLSCLLPLDVTFCRFFVFRGRE